MTEQDVKAWLAECTKLVVDEMRRKGFPVDDYRIELVLKENPRDPSQPLTATEIVARNATYRGPETPSFDEWFQLKYGTTFEAAHMQPMQSYESSIRALLNYSRVYISEVARSAKEVSMV